LPGQTNILRERAPIRILIVEDHLIARLGISTIVNSQPDMSIVAEAVNGQQAHALYRTHLPDVTLMDIRMPVMSGFEAVVAIRDEFPGARIVALSTFGGDEDIRRAITLGASAYLTKDCLNDELVEAIRTVHSGAGGRDPDFASAPPDIERPRTGGTRAHCRWAWK
jgi:DNA-binding NarL/FixJ family response regulator